VLSSLALPWLGHLAGGGVVGVLAAGSARIVARITSSTALPGSWDAFVKGSAPDRWVVVTLKAGDVFAGVVRVADVGVATEDRDLVLGEPALLDPKTGKYIMTPYHEIFLPAALIQNLAVLPRANDARVGPEPGAELFAKEDEHVERQRAEPSASTPTESGGEDREGGISPESSTGAP
jgi:hypothetical protein